MNIPICNFLLQMKNGNVRVFSLFFCLALFLLTENLAVSKQVYMDTFTYS
jgi:hypothetical protein